MNCRETQHMMGAGREADWPAEARAHLDVCADCRAAAGRERALARLLAVARAEAPDAGFDARMRARVRAGIASIPPAPVFWALPVMRYGLAAAALALAAVLPFYLNEVQSDTRDAGHAIGQAIDFSEPEPVPPMLAAPASGDALPFRMAEGLVPVLRLQEYADLGSGGLAGTNRFERIGPAGIQYGGESTTVDFRY